MRRNEYTRFTRERFHVRLTVHSIARLAQATKPPMLIEGVLGQRAIHIWSGMPYAGKTFLALEAMRAVAEPLTGPFLGRFKAPKAGNVLYLGNDSPDWDVAQQFDKVIGMPAREDMAAALAETAYGSYGFILDPSFNLTDAKDAQDLVDAANSFASVRDVAWDRDESTHIRGTSLIVIDTLRSVHGFEQNDNTEMQHLVNLLRYVSQNTGAAVLALHHFNKGYPGERDQVTLARIMGAVAITGGVDSVLALVPKKESVAVHVLKHRVAPEQKGFMYNFLDDGKGSVVFSLTSDVGVTNPSVLKVVEAALAGAEDWVKTGDLVKMVAGLPGMAGERKAEAATTRALQALEKAGKVVRVHGAARRATKEVQ